ncbi:hypothetical protein MMC32_000513 [Xylographa parallela]|nr:hypothetical protein [Xylographa parallela]
MPDFTAINEPVLNVTPPRREARNSSGGSPPHAQPARTAYPSPYRRIRRLPSLNAAGQLYYPPEDHAHEVPPSVNEREWAKHTKTPTRLYQCPAAGRARLHEFSSADELASHQRRVHCGLVAMSDLYCPVLPRMCRDGATAADGSSGIKEVDAAPGESLQSSQASHVHQPSVPPSSTTQQSLAHQSLQPSMGTARRTHHAVKAPLYDEEKVRACARTDWKASVQLLRQLLDSQEAELEGMVGEKRTLLKEYRKGKEMQVKKWKVKEAQILILQAMLSTARVGGKDAWT